MSSLYNKIVYVMFLSVFIMFQKCNNRIEMTAEKLHQKGMEYLQEGNHKKAHEFLAAAAKKKNESVFNWAAALSASTRNEAFIFAWKAWDSGLKSEEVLMFLLKVSNIATAEEKIAYGLRLLSEIPDTSNKELIRGKIYLDNGKIDSAMTIWKKSLHTSHNGHLVTVLGHIYLINDQYDSLMVLLSNADSSGYLDRQGYTLYAFALVHMAKFNEAKQILLKAQSDDMYNKKIGLDLVWIDVLSSNYNDAINNLKLAEKNNKSEDSFNICKLKHLEAFIYRQTLDTAELKKMKEDLCSLSIQNSACHFVESMILSVRGDISVVENLEKLYNSDPENPVFTLALVNECLLTGKLEKAVGLLSGLSLYLIRFPSIILMHTKIEASAGNYGTALEMLHSMHKRGAISKSSLELEQNIMFRLHMKDDLFSLQEIIEDAFPDDSDIRFKRALLFLKTGEADSALAVLDRLSTGRFPEKYIQLARIHAFFIKKEYEKIIIEIQKRTVTDPEMLVFKAKAELMQKDTIDALETLRLAVNNAKKNPFIYLEYARLLSSLRKYDRAASYYKKAVYEFEKNYSDYKRLATINGKAAWCQFKAGNDLDSALKYSRKAYYLNDFDVDIIYTHCLILSEKGLYDDAVKILKKYLQYNRNPVLLYCLGKIYKKTKQRKKLKIIYTELQEKSDSVLDISNLKRNIINELVN